MYLPKQNNAPAIITLNAQYFLIWQMDGWARGCMNHNSPSD